MQVIVAFILEAFVFRIQYRMVMNGQDMDGMMTVLHMSLFLAKIYQFLCHSFNYTPRLGENGPPKHVK